jgi:hypothetical protein
LDDYAVACEEYRRHEVFIENDSVDSCFADPILSTDSDVCKEHETELHYRVSPTVYCQHGTQIHDCAAYKKLVDDGVMNAENAMNRAVAKRKEVSQQANFSALKSLVLNTVTMTHATWLCAGPYSTYSFDINLSCSPTYDES